PGRGGHSLSDALRQVERPAPLLACDTRCAPGPNCVDKVGELETERLIVEHRNLPTLDGRRRSPAIYEAPYFGSLRGVVNGEVRRRLKEANPPDTIAADPAGGDVRNASVREPKSGVGDIDTGREHRHADRLDGFDVRGDQRQHDVEIVNHQIEH